MNGTTILPLLPIGRQVQAKCLVHLKMSARGTDLLPTVLGF
jgi:hypothetical protein